jgi:hypothetical protein
MPADNSIDKETRSIDQMRATKDNQYQIYQKSQNQLLQIQAAQKQNLAIQRANSNAMRAQNATLQQAAQLAAMSGGGGYVQQSVNPQTQAALQKYGMGKPRFQRQQNSSQQVSKQNVVIHNNTTNNTTNNVNAGGYGGPVQGRELRLRDNTIGFKTWISNTFLKQEEQAQLRDREYEKREAALTRNSNKMARKFESIGKTLSERFDPGRITSDMGKQFKALMLLLGLHHLRKNWKILMSKLSQYWDGFKKFASSFGITFDGSSRPTLEKVKHGIKTNFSSFGAQLIIAFGGNPRTDTIGSILKNLIIGDEHNKNRHYGLWLRIKDYLSMEFQERASAMQQVKFPKEALISVAKGDDVIKNLPKVINWLGNIVSVGIGGADALQKINYNQAIDNVREGITNRSASTEATEGFFDTKNKTSQVTTRRYSVDNGSGQTVNFYKRGDFGEIYLDDNTQEMLKHRQLSYSTKLNKYSIAFSKTKELPMSEFEVLNEAYTDKFDKDYFQKWVEDGKIDIDKVPDKYKGAVGILNKFGERDFWKNPANRSNLKHSIYKLKGDNSYKGEYNFNNNLIAYYSTRQEKEKSSEVLLGLSGKGTSLGNCSGLYFTDKEVSNSYAYGQADNNQLVGFSSLFGTKNYLKNLVSGTICYTGELSAGIGGRSFGEVINGNLVTSNHSMSGPGIVAALDTLQNTITRAHKKNGDFSFFVDCGFYKTITGEDKVSNTKELYIIVRDRPVGDVFEDPKIIAFANGYTNQAAANASGYGTVTNAVRGAAAGGAVLVGAALITSNPIGWAVGLTALAVGVGAYAIGKSEAFEGLWDSFWASPLPAFTGDVVTKEQLNDLKRYAEPVTKFGITFCPAYLQLPEVALDGKGFIKKLTGGEVIARNIVSVDNNSGKYDKNAKPNNSNTIKAPTISYSKWTEFIKNIFKGGSEELEAALEGDRFDDFSFTDSYHISDVLNAVSKYDGGQFNRDVNASIEPIKHDKIEAQERMKRYKQMSESYWNKKAAGRDDYNATFGKKGGDDVQNALSEVHKILKNNDGYGADFKGDVEEINAKIAPLLGVLYEKSKLNPKNGDNGIFGVLDERVASRLLEHINKKHGKSYSKISDATREEQLEAALWELKTNYGDVYKRMTNVNSLTATQQKMLNNDLNLFLGSTSTADERKRAVMYTNSIMGGFSPEYYYGGNNNTSRFDFSKVTNSVKELDFKSLVTKYTEEIYRSFKEKLKDNDRYLKRSDMISFQDWKNLPGNGNGSFVDWQKAMAKETGISPEDVGISGEGAFLDSIISGEKLKSSSIYGTKAIMNKIYDKEALGRQTAIDIKASVDNMFEKEKTTTDIYKQLENINDGVNTTNKELTLLTKSQVAVVGSNEGIQNAINTNTKITAATGNRGKVTLPSKTN